MHFVKKKYIFVFRVIVTMRRDYFSLLNSSAGVSNAVGNECLRANEEKLVLAAELALENTARIAPFLS
jgi:hypothetical protein